MLLNQPTYLLWQTSLEIYLCHSLSLPIIGITLCQQCCLATELYILTSFPFFVRLLLSKLWQLIGRNLTTNILNYDRDQFIIKKRENLTK